MTCLYRLYIFIFIFLSPVAKTSAKDIISLEVRLKKNTLKLICKVWNPSLSINFYSTQEKIIARCLTFPTPKCVCFENNSQIDFDPYTNETILKIWNIPSANGKWTCRHGGSKYDQAARVGIDLENLDVSLACVSAIVFCMVFIVGILVGLLIFVLLKYLKSREKPQADETVPLGVISQ